MFALLYFSFVPLVFTHDSELSEVFHEVLNIIIVLPLFLFWVFWFLANNLLDQWTEYWIMT